MSTRHNVKVGADVEQLDLMAEHGHAARTTVIAGIAVFEGENPLPAEDAVIIANQFQGTAGNRFIEKLQAFLGTRLACRRDADFTRPQAVQPEPQSGAQGTEKQ